MGRFGSFVLVLGLVLTGCTDGGSTDGSSTPDSGNDGAGEGQRYPDVRDVEVEESGGTYDVTVTIASPYDTPERYADGWRVKGGDGTVYGEHELGHDHENEQPFTRTQSGVEIPDKVEEVTVEGRDSENGYGGETVSVDLP